MLTTHPAVRRRAINHIAQNRSNRAIRIEKLLRSSLLKKNQHKLQIINKMMILPMAILIVGIGYFGYTYYSNIERDKEADEIIAESNPLNNDEVEDNGAGDGTNSEDARITSNGIVIPSTDKPTLDEIFAFQAPPDYPKRIEFKGIVLAMVTTVDDTNYGEIGVPANIYNAAWYVKSSKLGQTPGASIITGHVGFRNIEGVFKHLDTLTFGDEIKITMGDDRVLTYKVTAKKSIPVDSFKVSDFLSYNDTSKSLLHLITCDGTILPGGNQYSSRLVITTELQ